MEVSYIGRVLCECWWWAISEIPHPVLVADKHLICLYWKSIFLWLTWVEIRCHENLVTSDPLFSWRFFNFKTFLPHKLPYSETPCIKIHSYLYGACSDFACMNVFEAIYYKLRRNWDAKLLKSVAWFCLIFDLWYYLHANLILCSLVVFQTNFVARPLDYCTNQDLWRRNEDDKKFYLSWINLVIYHNSQLCTTIYIQFSTIKFSIN